VSTCRACQDNDCEACTGCWHETTHDFSDRFDNYDEDAAIDRAERRYDTFYDRMWGDAA
jgi:hypothetical protein